MVGKTKAQPSVLTGPSGAEVQPWYGLTEIDDELANVVYFHRREKGQARVYDLHFMYRSTPVAMLSELDAQAVQQAVGHANAWMITTATTEAGVLSDSKLAGAYGLSPKEMKRRARLTADDERGCCKAPPSRERTATDGSDTRRMAIVRGLVEDAAHQVLADNVANPTARMQVLIAISTQLHAHAKAGRISVR